MNSFSTSMKPEQVQILNHSSGNLTVSISNGINWNHLSFATPYEAWKWANELTATLADQMKAEVQS
jgi:hypothetical protein